MKQEGTETLVAQWQSGDEEAYAEIVKRYLPIVVNLAYRYLKDRHLAEDIAQEIFMKLYREPQTWKPTAKFSTWLYRVALNACTDEWRRRKKLANLEDSSFQPIREIISPMRSPSEELGDQERITKVRQAIDSLDSFQRQLILLYQEGLSYKEMAGILHCSIKAVERRLWRAKQRLRKLLALI